MMENVQVIIYGRGYAVRVHELAADKDVMRTTNRLHGTENRLRYNDRQEKLFMDGYKEDDYSKFNSIF